MIAKTILKRIQGKSRGWVFTPKDFMDIGSRDAVDQALSRLARRQTIRRLGRGLYDYPRQNRRLGVMAPPMDAVASAVARKTNSRLQVSGAQAANSLRLSTQVPAHRTYLTDGPTRRICIGRQCINLLHSSPRNLIGAGKTTGMVFQALRYFGRDGIDDAVIQRLRDQLPPRDKSALKRDAVQMPDWMNPVIDQIVGAA